jgi:hypothetical protein
MKDGLPVGGAVHIVAGMASGLLRQPALDLAV